MKNSSRKYSDVQQPKDDSEEEWAVESCMVVIEPVEEVVEKVAILKVSKEIEEKMPESMKVSQNRDPIPSMQMQQSQKMETYKSHQHMKKHLKEKNGEKQWKKKIQDLKQNQT